MGSTYPDVRDLVHNLNDTLTSLQKYYKDEDFKNPNSPVYSLFSSTFQLYSDLLSGKKCRAISKDSPKKSSKNSKSKSPKKSKSKSPKKSKSKSPKKSKSKSKSPKKSKSLKKSKKTKKSKKNSKSTGEDTTDSFKMNKFSETSNSSSSECSRKIKAPKKCFNTLPDSCSSSSAKTFDIDTSSKKDHSNDTEALFDKFKQLELKLCKTR